VAHKVTTLTARKAQRVTADLDRKVRKSRARVNRTGPKVSVPNLDPMFGMNVTTETLSRARVFPEQLIPTCAASISARSSSTRTGAIVCAIRASVATCG
jgi:hypothetical protein